MLLQLVDGRLEPLLIDLGLSKPVTSKGAAAEWTVDVGTPGYGMLYNDGYVHDRFAVGEARTAASLAGPVCGWATKKPGCWALQLPCIIIS